MTTFTVTTAIDENNGVGGAGLSLREAIGGANTTPGDDIIEFDESLTGEIITLTLGEISIIGDLTINGLGADVLTISGNNSSRIFNIDDLDSSIEVNVEINELTISEGFSTSDGGAIFNSENLEINNSIISTNNSDLSGGGIYGGTITVNNSTISGNSAELEGGGILGIDTITINNSNISDNNSNYGDIGRN